MQPLPHSGGVRPTARASLPTDHGRFDLHLFVGADGKEHLALVRGDLGDGRGVLVRAHSECFTGDVLGSRRCDCGGQLATALAAVAAEGRGVVLYLRQEGRGIGLAAKLDAYNLQDLGYDTVEANGMLGFPGDARDYAPAAAMLRHLGVSSVRLLSNNPAKVRGLTEHGIVVVGRVPVPPRVTAENLGYLATKARRMAHLLDALPPAVPAEEGDGAGAAEGGNGHGGGTAPPAAAGNGHPSGNGHAEAAALGGEPPAAPAAGRPFVTVSYAQSLDGSIAPLPRRPLPLSGEESMVLTHRLRAAHAGILVGIGTVLVDDPRLTVRLVESAREPQPVVLDSRLRTPPGCRLLGRGGRRVWIATGSQPDRGRQRRLERAGARVLRLPLADDGRLDLSALLGELEAAGVASLMVEGGARVISSFFARRLVDRLVVTTAPTLLAGLPAVSRQHHRRRLHLPRLEDVRYQTLGRDVVLWGRPTWDDPAA